MNNFAQKFLCLELNINREIIYFYYVIIKEQRGTHIKEF